VAVAKKKIAKKKEPVVTDWKSQFVSKFPQFARILDGAGGEAEARSVFGDDVIDLVLDVAKNPDNYDFSTQAGIDYFDSKVYGTKYYNETSTSAKTFDALTPGEREDKIRINRTNIASTFGDLGLTATELSKISTDATRRGLTGAGLNYYVNSIVGGRARGESDLLESLDAQALMKVADAYGYKPTDLNQQILAGVQGKEYNGEIVTADTFKKKGIANAKATYFQLTPQLDAGLTLGEIFQPYRDTASRVLELAPDSINFNDPKWSVAFGSSTRPPLSMGEFLDEIKTKPKYGYGNTKQAKSDAKQIVQSLAEIFGKVK
jgi:hypothetical protein